MAYIPKPAEYESGIQQPIPDPSIEVEEQPTVDDIPTVEVYDENGEPLPIDDTP